MHRTFSTTLTDEHREELRRQADQARQAHWQSPLWQARSQWRAGRWWRPAGGPLEPELVRLLVQRGLFPTAL